MKNADKNNKKPRRSVFKAEHYGLRLEVDEHGSFKGILNIDGQKSGPPSRRITLYQTGLKIEVAEIIYHDKNGRTHHDTLRINHLKSFGEVRLHTAAMLFPGTYSLKITYRGRLVDEPVFGQAEHSFNDPSELKLDKLKPQQVLPCIAE